MPELHVGQPSKIEPESKESSTLEDGDAFSFQAGRRDIDYQKVRSFCIDFLHTNKWPNSSTVKIFKESQ
jgi:hypothetical protein